MFPAPCPRGGKDRGAGRKARGAGAAEARTFGFGVQNEEPARHTEKQLRRGPAMEWGSGVDCSRRGRGGQQQRIHDVVFELRRKSYRGAVIMTADLSSSGPFPCPSDLSSLPYRCPFCHTILVLRIPSCPATSHAAVLRIPSELPYPIPAPTGRKVSRFAALQVPTP
ncbi:unnamed protein product [Calypogeia fissa]